MTVLAATAEQTTTAADEASSEAAAEETTTEETAAEEESAEAEEPVAKAIDKNAFDQLVSSGVKADDADIAASEWATKVKEAGVLRVGGVRTSFLFSQLDETDGSLRGFDAGLWQLLANYILGDSSAFEITQVDSSTRESVLQSDQVDAVFATYSITDSRKEVISFAGPYYTSQQGILVAAGNSDITGVDTLAGKVVVTQAGSTGPDILAEFAPEAEIQEFETDQEAITALSQGRVDAYVTDYTLQLSTLVKNPGVYNIAGDAFGPVDPYGIGLPKDSDGVEFVNEFLKKIEEDGTWEQLWKLTAIAFSAAFVIGIIVTVMRISPVKPLRVFAEIYVQIFRNISGAALLILLVYALPYLNMLFSYFTCVVIATTLIPSAFCSEYLMSGINTIDVGQIEAARALGLTFSQVIRKIVIPQALRSSVLPLTNLLVSTMLTTALASQVPMNPRDLTGLVSHINTHAVGGVMAFFISAFFYSVTAVIIGRISIIIDRKVRIIR